MLRIYDVWLQVLEAFRHVLPLIRKHDVNLEDQLRRAATSVLLNLAEGSGSRGRLRSLRYSNALGSARECHACLDAARALGYLGVVDPLLTEKLNAVIGTLVKVAR